MSGPDSHSPRYTQIKATSESFVLKQYKLDDFLIAVYLEIRDQPNANNKYSVSKKVRF